MFRDKILVDRKNGDIRSICFHNKFIYRGDFLNEGFADIIPNHSVLPNQNSKFFPGHKVKRKNIHLLLIGMVGILLKMMDV